MERHSFKSSHYVASTFWTDWMSVHYIQAKPPTTYISTIFVSQTKSLDESWIPWRPCIMLCNAFCGNLCRLQSVLPPSPIYSNQAGLQSLTAPGATSVRSHPWIVQQGSCTTEVFHVSQLTGSDATLWCRAGSHNIIYKSTDGDAQMSQCPLQYFHSLNQIIIK